MPIVVLLSELDYLPKRPSQKNFRNILESQGQTVPIRLDAGMECVDWYGEDYIAAARDLQWPTILVTWPGESRHLRRYELSTEPF